jgi:SNF2 family DNA or RNA helicase
MKLLQLGSKPYFEHQRAAIEWMINREETPLFIGDYEISGGILADEMGLGKTFELLGLIANRPLAATLILTPLAVLETWIRTAYQSGLFTIYTVQGTAGAYCWRRHSLVRGAPAIYITNMEKLIRNPSLSLTQHDEPMNRLIVDEAHKLRNCMGSTFEAICNIVAGHRWAATATPVVNSLRDVASLIHFIGHGETPLEKPLHWSKHYEDIIPLFVMQRTVAQLRGNLDFLPAEPVEEIISLPFETHEEEEFYNAIQGNIRKKLAGRYEHDKLDGAQKLLMLLRLRQISVHPQVYISSRKKLHGYYDRDDWTEPSTKFVQIAETLRKEVAEKNNYLIFCSFQEEIKLLKRYLKSEGVAGHIEVYYGEMTAEQRERALQRVQQRVEDENELPTVFICQINSGGVGLNLQYLNRVIFMSPWWTSATMKQAIGRVIRIGQKRNVKITYLQLNAEYDEGAELISIDNLIYGAVKRKEKIAADFFAMVAGRSADLVEEGEEEDIQDDNSDIYLMEDDEIYEM